MICYRCGMAVGTENVCPNCGADVRVFHKIIRISNAYYNDGLQKASVRNLSGAILSLKSSLKFNKYNTDARNLLGLIYFEMGEVVDALSEWVISRHYQPEDNRATHYIQEIQQNRQRLDTINQTIKKYNQALMYCKSNSKDLAIIQLKKVLSLNPNLVKAHQLLALLYMEDEKYDLAKKSLRNAGKIDTDNTTTLRYLKEVNGKLREKHPEKKQKNEDLISYRSGNDTIIMPKRFRETSVGSTLISVLIGLVVGVAATSFLFIPNVKNIARGDAKKQLIEANDTISSNEQKIKTLQNEIEELHGKIDDANESAESVKTQITEYDKLLAGYMAFVAGDFATAGNNLATIDTGKLSEAAVNIYNTVNEQAQSQYLEYLYNDGNSKYNGGDFAGAIDSLLKVCQKDMNFKDGYAVFNLANAYRKNNDFANARTYYQYMVENYPGSQRASQSQGYIDSMPQ